LFNANSAILSVISWREQVNLQLDDDDVRFVLDQQAYRYARTIKEKEQRLVESE
jgi:hypothetical protein